MIAVTIVMQFVISKAHAMRTEVARSTAEATVSHS
jgi:hypothetical protein